MAPDKTRDLRSLVEGIDKLIHEPARLLLMAHLYIVEEADFVFLVDQTKLTAGNASSHMKKLISAEYVSQTKTFVRNRPQTTYQLSSDGRSAFEAYRKTMESILEILPGD